jgi:hypothetical protein
MNYKLSTAKPEKTVKSVVVVGCVSSTIKRGSTLERLDKKLKGHVGRILKREDFKGKTGEAKLIHAQGQLP